MELVYAHIAFAGACTWTGFVDSNWFDNKNWKDGCNLPFGVPGPLDNVDIPGTGVVNEPSIDGSIVVNSRNVSGGRILSVVGQIQVIWSFANQGTLVVNHDYLDFIGPSFSNSGSVVGDGTMRVYGSLSLWGGTVFSPVLELVSGTTRVNGVFSGSVVVDAGATFDQICVYPPGIVVKADLVVNGTITGACAMWFLGEEVSNQGVIGPSQFVFEGGNPILSGAGTWNGEAVYVELTSTLKLANDVTLEVGNLFVSNTSSLDLMGHTLALSGTLTFDHQASQAATVWCARRATLRSGSQPRHLPPLFRRPSWYRKGRRRPTAGSMALSKSLQTRS